MQVFPEWGWRGMVPVDFSLSWSQQCLPLRVQRLQLLPSLPCLFPEWGRGSHLAVWNLGKASGDVTVSQTDLKPILILASLTLTPTPRGTHCCQFMILMGILAYKLGWFPFCAVSLGFNFLSIFSGRLGKLPLI